MIKLAKRSSKNIIIGLYKSFDIAANLYPYRNRAEAPKYANIYKSWSNVGFAIGKSFEKIKSSDPIQTTK